MNIIKQVTFDSARRRKDKTFSFSFTTDLEQSKEDINNIFDCVDNGGVLYFKPSGLLTDEEIKEVEKTKIKREGKSKSQLLRDVTYVRWKQLHEAGKTKKDFADYYAKTMDKIIQLIKDKLE